jgi:hypothetical protein
MTLPARNDLPDIATRLMRDDAFVVTYYESPEPGGPRQHRRPARISCLTPKGEAALEYANIMDQLVLEAYSRVTTKLRDGEHAEIIWRRRGELLDPAELEPCREGLVARGYLRQTASGYVVTAAGEAAVTAYHEAHPTWTGNFRVINPSGIDRRTRDEARELAKRRRQEALRTAEDRWP